MYFLLSKPEPNPVLVLVWQTQNQSDWKKKLNLGVDSVRLPYQTPCTKYRTKISVYQNLLPLPYQKFGISKN